MNYAGTFGSEISDDAAVSLTDHHLKIDSGNTPASAAIAHDTIVIPDAQLLFAGDFNRLGNDLMLSKDGHQFLVEDYFRGEKRAFLASPDGASLSGDVVQALTGHVQYAQAAGASGPAKDIGQVAKLVGTATVIRNGVLVELHNGDRVYKGDVVQAGANSAVSIVFVDGSVFGLSANARMVLNEMVYDQAGSSNSALISLVRGTVSFVAGETAKHGDMKVETPVATMGIRGTAVLVEIGFEIPTDGKGAPVNFQVLMEPDGTTGSYVIYSKSDPGTVIGTVDKAGQVYSVSSNGTFANLPSQEMSQIAISIIQQVFTQKFSNYVPDKPTPPPSSGGGAGSTPATPPDATIPKLPTAPTDSPVIVPINVQVPDDNGGTKTVTIPVGVSILKNTAPTIDVHDVVTNAPNFSFKIADQVTITDPDAYNSFHDVATPYVPGTVKIVSTSGLPYGVQLTDLVTINSQTGAVTFNNNAFGYLKPGEQAVIIIGFDSKSGPDTVHETLKLTVNGVNDTPIIQTASLAVVPGVPFLLSPSDITVLDPDDNSFTFTATATHGTFQVENGDNVWTDSTTFTSADLAAGHVRFLSDGSNTAPTVTLTATDGGHAISPIFNVAVDFANSNIHLSSTGLEVDVPSGGATNGFSFPDTNTGNVTTPGTPEDRIVLGYHLPDVTNPIVLNSDPMLNVSDFTPISSSAHTEGSDQSVTTVLGAGNGVILTQTISLGTSANFFTTTIDVYNGSDSSIDGVRFLRNFDPDQDVGVGGSYSTKNDVYQGSNFTIVSATGLNSNVTVAMIGLGAQWHGSVYGFTNTDPYDPNAYATPQDPNGATNDLSLTLTYDFGNIASGDHVQISYITTDNIATVGDNALFGTSGNDVIDGYGGNDLLIGLSGADIFVFSPGSGHDTVLDFQHSDGDQIDLTALAGIYTFADVLANAIQSGPDTILTFGTDTLTLSNVKSTNLVADDFILASSPAHLVEATASDPGVPSSVDHLSIGSATYDLVALAGHGWTDNGSGNWSLDQTYGTVTLSTSANTLTYTLDNSLADSLTSSDHLTENVSVYLLNGTNQIPSQINVAFTIDGANDAPTISTDGAHISEGASSSDPVTISGISIFDPDSGDTVTPTATADHGSVQADLTSFTYTPPASPESLPLTATVALTVMDSHDATDTVNFIFNVAGTTPVTLTGTDAKDVYFGSANQDNFVFAPNSNHDTIIGFSQAQHDQIDLQQFTNITEDNITTLFSSVGNDTLIHLNPSDPTDHDTILVKNVHLTANDFIVHPGSA